MRSTRRHATSHAFVCCPNRSPPWPGRPCIIRQPLMGRARTILWLTLLVNPVVPALAAQSSGGSLAGRVTDEQDAAVSGVLITAKNLSTGFLRATSSDDGGAYYLTALPV